MASLGELRAVRLAKIEKLESAGMSAYPTEITRDYTLNVIERDFASIEKTGTEVTVAARITAIRGAGSIMFIVLTDGTAIFQAVLKKDELEESIMNLFKDTVDIGDFVQFTGPLFVTEKGQNSLLVKSWKMAGKTLLPMPEKWSGITDTDEIYRKRYLDLMSNNESFNRFKLRSNVIKAIRAYFDERDFMEIETPILQNQAGGAMARTFNTYHNDLGIDMVLRISLELEHKMIMAGGYSRIYEIGKNFRNEGSDPTHIQEFTMMEWYAAYETLEQNMNWTEDLLKHLARDIVGKTEFKVYDDNGDETIVDFSGEWKRVRFPDLLHENAGLDIETASRDEIEIKASEWGMDRNELLKTGTANLLDFIYKKSSRNKIIHPTFVMDYPGDLKPLAQQNDDGTARVCQLIIAGAEVTNQYAELVNPLKQRELLESQSSARESGDDEAMQLDERFIVAMEHGMPPMTGFGMGIDRLMAIFSEQKNLRDVIFFPIMKEKIENKHVLKFLLNAVENNNFSNINYNSKKQVFIIDYSDEKYKLTEKWLTDPEKGGLTESECADVKEKLISYKIKNK
ncbi:MAG: lysine--tRNA ligase [Candidatus Pacebacteria bacterium]|nr:lysine--tRNA ligase [Candidatus Paceibacterota bacterium]